MHITGFWLRGGGYKDYYSKCLHVTGVDTNPNALLHLRAFFPDASKVRLIWAPFLYTSLPNSYDCVLVSAVLSYMPYSTGLLLLDECTRLLKPGGIIVLALVASRGLSDLISGNRLYELPTAPGSFHRKYSTRETAQLIEERGFDIRTTDRYIVKLPPRLRGVTNRFYKYKTVKFFDTLINKLPGFSTWHIVVGSKK